MKSSKPFSAAVWAAGRTVADPRISPDGQEIAFVTNVGDRAEIAVVDAEGGAERWLPVEPSVKRVSSGGGVIDWLPDGSGIVYIGVDGCIHCFDFARSASRSISRWTDAVSSLAVSPKGDEVAFVVDLRDVAVASLAFDASGWPRRVSSGADFAMDPAWSPDGVWLTWHEWDVPNMPWDGSRIAVRRADGSGPVMTVAGGDGVAVQQPRFSPDGTRLSYVGDADGWLNVWLLDVPSFEGARPLLSAAGVSDEPDRAEHGGPSWGPGQRSYCWTRDGRSVVIGRNQGGWGRLMTCAIEAGKVTDLGRGTFTGLVGGDGVVVGVRADAASASSIERIDLSAIEELEAGRRVVARGPMAGLERAGTEPEPVSWTSDDGATVHGRLYRSTAGTSGEHPPLLVWVHGGPTGQSPVTLYARFGYFLERGWSVLVVDYRGSTGWGREYTQALQGRWGDVDVRDVAAGMRAAITNGWGDPHKMVPYGGSAGGFTALLLLAQYPELCAAGIVSYPVVDLIGLTEDTWRFEAHYPDGLVGPLPGAYEQYVERSPKAHAANITTPVLIMHGDGDNVVPVGQSIDLAEQLRRAGAPVELQVYEGEGHGWRKSATIVDELERSEGFLRRYVLRAGPRMVEET